MIRAITRYLTRKAIRAQRAKALAELQAAIRRGDTRRQHKAELEAKTATERALRMGV
jgi:hypothetical protein